MISPVLSGVNVALRYAIGLSVGLSVEKAPALGFQKQIHYSIF